MSAVLLNKDVIRLYDENGKLLAQIKPHMTSAGKTMDNKKFLDIKGTVIK